MPGLFVLKLHIPVKNVSVMPGLYNPLSTGNSNTGSFTNMEDQNEMLQDVEFHQGLHCLLRFKQSSKTELQLN